MSKNNRQIPQPQKPGLNNAAPTQESAPQPVVPQENLEQTSNNANAEQHQQAQREDNTDQGDQNDVKEAPGANQENEQDENTPNVLAEGVVASDANAGQTAQVESVASQAVEQLDDAAKATRGLKDNQGGSNKVEVVSNEEKQKDEDKKDAPKRVTVEDVLPGNLQEKFQGLSASSRMNIQRVTEYIVKMGPGQRMTTEQGVRQQVSLYRAIMSIMNTAEDDFKDAFTIVLRLFETYKDGAFNERYIFRFMAELTLATQERAAFQRVLTTLKVLAPFKGRELALRQVDFEKSFQYGLTEQGRQKVSTYFNK